MPSDVTRRLLRTFGVAVTQLEDAVIGGSSAEEIHKAEDQARTCLSEIKALIDRLATSRETPNVSR